MHRCNGDRFLGSPSPGDFTFEIPDSRGSPRESPGMYVSGNFGEMSNFGEFFCVFYDLDFFFAFIILEIVIGHTNK